MSTTRAPGRNRSRQRGASAIEFALVAPVFLTLLIAAMELGRVLFYMNSAAEATRLGARVAVVCDIDAAGIKRRMGQVLALLTPDMINVSYSPAGCNPSSCRSVTVSVAPALTVATAIPFVTGGFAIPIPAFSTTLPRESMDSTNNDLCT